MLDVNDVMALAPVIPVLVVDDVAVARPIADGLVGGGLRALEVTLRTPAALDVIREMAMVEGAVVGAGTVLSARQLEAAVEAGARFIVSPGLTATVVEAARDAGVPILPGVSTASDIMRGLDLGLDRFKFFPAEASGGLPALKALAAPFGAARFCPTGGITLASAPEWLAHRSVLCVGGSWVVPHGPIDTAEIRHRAQKAAALRR